MKKLKTPFIILFALIALSGCHKPGCMDTLATNYDEKAKMDDLSCSYNGSVVFWCEKETSDSLVAWGNPMLYFVIDNVLVDSIATGAFFSLTGNCNTGGTKTFPQDFTGNTKRTYHYTIYGATYGTIWDDYVQIRANDCTSDQLPMP